MNISNPDTFLKPYDLILVGSGFGAIPVAEQMHNQRVLIIETGPLSQTQEYSILSRQPAYGHYNSDHWQGHWVRAFGGTSSRWAGWVSPLDERDFKAPHVDAPAWPITFSDLEPYYRKAAIYLNRDPSIIDYSTVIEDSNFIHKPFSNQPYVDQTRLRDHYEPVQKNGNVDILLETNVTKLHTDDAGHINGIDVFHADQTMTLTLKPQQVVVLAAGGLGNAQILLQPAPNRQTAVGNESGLVGCFLMEHPHVKSADIFLTPEWMPTPPESFGMYTDSLIVNDATYYRDKLLGCTLDVGLFDIEEHEASPFQRDAEALLGKKLKPGRVFARSEQEPQITNRCTITDERDWTGAFKMRVHCSFSSKDLFSIEQTTRRLGEYFSDAGIGMLKIDNDSIYRTAGGGGHIMGTTRMGTSVENSVCNANQQVHGYQNLYVSGSSLFTTSGASNPTLTITALSFRLADILKNHFEKESLV